MELEPVAHVESPLTDRASAPMQGDEGAPEAALVFAPVRRRIRRPHGGRRQGSAGRASGWRTRIGLHRVRVVAIDGLRMRVRDLEALDGTLVIDVKPILRGVADR